jgi:hypothetical protein
MKANTKHSIDLDVPDDGVRVATGVAYGLGISVVLGMMVAAVVALLL